MKILLLGRRYSQKDLLEGINVALKFGALDHFAIEYIIRNQEANYRVFDEKTLQKKLKSEHVNSWAFDLSVYKELCEEVLL